MNVLGKGPLAVAAIAAVAALGCAEEEALDRYQQMDAGNTPMDAGRADAGDAGSGDGGTTCVRVMSSTSACSSPTEVAAFCSGGAAEATGTCARAAATTPGAPDTRTCLTAAWGDRLRADCISCYVASAECTASECLSSCLTDSPACDACQMERCGPNFLGCAGYSL